MRTRVIIVFMLAFGTLLWLTRPEHWPLPAAEPASAPQPPAKPLPRQAVLAQPEVANRTAVLEPLTAAIAASSVRSTDWDEATAAPRSESDLLQDGVWVDVQRTVRLASTHEGFNKLLQMLASSSSVEISQRQASYQNLFMSDPLYLSGDLQVGQVTCGESVCAAFVTGPTAQQLTAFIARLRSSQRPPIYSLTALDVPAGASRAGTRLIFSINLVRDSKFSIRRRTRT